MAISTPDFEGGEGEKVNAALTAAYGYINKVRKEGTRPFHMDNDVFPQEGETEYVWELDHTYCVIKAVIKYCENFLLEEWVTFQVDSGEGKVEKVSYTRDELIDLGIIAGAFHDVNYAATSGLNGRLGLSNDEKGEIISARVAEEWMIENGYKETDIAVVREAILCTVVYPPDYEYMTSYQREAVVARNPLALFLATADLVGGVIDRERGAFELINNQYRLEAKYEGDIGEFIKGQYNFLRVQTLLYRNGFNKQLEAGIISDPNGLAQEMFVRVNNVLNDKTAWKDFLQLFQQLEGMDDKKRHELKRELAKKTVGVDITEYRKWVEAKG